MGGKGKKKGKGKKQQQNDDEEKVIMQYSLTLIVANWIGHFQEEGANGNGGSKKGKKGKKGGGKKGSGKFQGDMFSESAMENAYYICHNVMVSWKLC